MIQTSNFYLRPYWQRLLLGLGLIPVVIVAVAVEFVMAVLAGIVNLLREIAHDGLKHVVHLYRFYRYDVLSPDPKKYAPQPDPDFWEAQ